MVSFLKRIFVDEKTELEKLKIIIKEFEKEISAYSKETNESIQCFLKGQQLVINNIKKYIKM